MNHTPNDPAFMRVVDQEIQGSWADERVLFIDDDNKIRVVIYASEFRNGRLQSERDRLIDDGVLKGIVHISATVLGARTGQGPRYSTVEYLPNEEFYVRQHIIRSAVWVTQNDIIQAALDATTDVFNGEESDDETGSTDEQHP